MRFITVVTLLLLAMNTYSSEADICPDAVTGWDDCIQEELDLPFNGIDAPLVEVDPLTGALDIDGDGTTDALSDGIIVLRWLFGIRGEGLTEGVLGPNATRDYNDITIILNSYMPN